MVANACGLAKERYLKVCRSAIIPQPNSLTAVHSQFVKPFFYQAVCYAIVAVNKKVFKILGLYIQCIYFYILKQIKMIKSKREAFATHCGLDFAETEDYRYHYGHTTQPVWAFDTCYYCVTKINQRPAKHRSGIEWNWVEVKNDFVNQFGYMIWRSNTEVNA